jgi:hypothetical protein
LVAVEHREIHTRREVLATRRHDDHAHLAGVAELGHDLGKLTPERRDHGVELVRTRECDVADPTDDIDVETAIAHAAVTAAYVSYSSSVSA